MKNNGSDKVPPPETTEAPENQLVQKKAEPTTEEIEEFVRDAPPAVRTMIRGMMMTSSMSRSPQHPIFDKFTPAHVDKFLDYNEADSKRDFTFACQNRWFHLVYVLLSVIFLSFLIIFLIPSNKELLNDLLRVLIAFAGGFGAGVGWKSRK